MLGAPSAQPTQVGTHGLPQEDKDTPALVVTHHDGPGDHFADHRLAFGPFQKATHTLGPTSPLQLTPAAGPPTSTSRGLSARLSL